MSHPSPAGALRERAALCPLCRLRTWHACGRCSRHCDCAGLSRADDELLLQAPTEDYLATLPPERVARSFVVITRAHRSLHELHRPTGDGYCMHCSAMTGQAVTMPCPTLTAAALPMDCCREVGS